VSRGGKAEAVKGELLFGRVLSPGELGPLRTLLTAWTNAESLDADMVNAIVLSGYEVLANSVEHGYPGHDGGPVELYADHTGDLVTVTVVDHGGWCAPPTDPGVRGRGLSLVRGLTTTADIAGSDHGTTVTMTWRGAANA
jgi:anti-sigma regulatory factor (Ser/Thr protein kinase)